MHAETPGSSPAALRGGEGSFSQIQTILLLGSGALKIGEAGEFDYSGSQAIKAFKEEGKRVIVVNPNIATYQTSEGLADGVYFVPVTPHFVEKVVATEHPDAIALSFGGQTALNCGIALADSGVLATQNVRVIGTPMDGIRKTEDRALFKEELESIDVAVPRSFPCRNIEEALRAAEGLGYPVIVRAGFTLGGKGSGRAVHVQELRELLQKTFAESHQVLVEEDLTGWKEIEYEVVRDSAGNTITVCNMENVDPMGIHTGESIVVAPSQTLDNTEYHMLRSVAQRVIAHFGIVGECNIQYALHPRSREYRIIEVNARLSRSSALASKATGYPLAFVAAKLALGFSLPELRNAITGVTSADFEPALDYVAVKVPRWDLQKFRFASEQVTSEMKSVGEVMALGRTFEEALQKAIRMLNIGAEGLFSHPFTSLDLSSEMQRPTPRRLFAIADAFSRGAKVEDVAQHTEIDPWFLERIKYCSELKNNLRPKGGEEYSSPTIEKVKRAGFSDAEIASRTRTTVEEVREHRKRRGILPVVKQIDTLAGEFPSRTNYLYMTYHGTESDVTFDEGVQRYQGNPSTRAPLGVGHRQGIQRTHSSDSSNSLESSDSSPKRVLVLGGGPYSIGSSVEFDWCCVQAVKELQKQGYEVTMVNSNPETVSTDYDECSTLFFEELTEERVRDIVDILQQTPPLCHPSSSSGQAPEVRAGCMDSRLSRARSFAPHHDTRRASKGDTFAGVVISMGGQIPNSLALKLSRAGIPILGTTPENIDRAEDRHKFSSLLDTLEIDQPEWKEFSSFTEAQKFSKAVGYPVIVRPSYVLSGAAMAVVHSSDDLEAYLNQAALVSREAPVVVSKFEVNAKEIDFDGVAQNGELLLYAVGEHVENAGVHSGDATIVMPPQRVNIETFNQMKTIVKKIVKGLHISGPFNVQFLAKDNRLKVIECNLRASRSFPFASKVTGENFATLSTQALLKIAPTDRRYQTIDLNHVAVKAAQFSFSRLKGADPRLGVEMSSTGEVACFGRNAEQALLLSLLAVGFTMPKKNILLTIGPSEDKIELLPSIQKLLEMGFALFTTEKTNAFLKERSIPSIRLFKVSEPKSPNIREELMNRRMDLVVNIPLHAGLQEQTDGYFIRRLAADHSIPLITNVQLFKRLVEALIQEKLSELPVLRWPDLLSE